MAWVSLTCFSSSAKLVKNILEKHTKRTQCASKVVQRITGTSRVPEIEFFRTNCHAYLHLLQLCDYPVDVGQEVVAESKQSS